MKHFLLTLIACGICIICGAQQRSAKVRLKDGKAFSGRVVEFNPVSHITLNIAGFDAKFEMADVVEVEEIEVDSSMQAEENSLEYASNLITEDTSRYPEKYILKVGPYEIEMTLIKGDVFKMGFDGRWSLRMQSEPVHPVAIHSFYVNTKPLSREIVTYLNRGKERKSKTNSEEAYTTCIGNDVEEIVKKLNERTELPIALISEAQWEYIATNRIELFSMLHETNYCYDFFAPYYNSEDILIDPIGPAKGEQHVVRTFAFKPDVYARYGATPYSGPTQYCIRFSFQAAVLPDN